MKPIYLDYAASTPVDPRVLKAMQPYFTGAFGNPGSLHSFGQQAMGALDKSRESLARLLEVRFEEVIFTGSATEANNLALKGAVKRFKETYPDRVPKILISAIEHESVLECAKSLESEGAKLVILPVDKEGFVSPKSVSENLDEDSVIVSVIRGSNEIGVIEDIQAIAKLIADWRLQKKSRYPLFHTDASQSFPYEGLKPKQLGVSLATISSQKCYGPKGVGALYIETEIKDLVAPLITGGGQESGLRSGTENVPGIVGFAAAAQIAAAITQKESRRLMELKEFFMAELKKIRRNIKFNGNLKRGGSVVYKRELPHILSVRFPGLKSADLLVAMDLAGLSVSAGSACRSRSNEPSYVLNALGSDDKLAAESLRFSFGRGTTRAELRNALKVIKAALKVY